MKKFKSVLIISLLSLSALLFAFTPTQSECEVPTKYQKMENPTTPDKENLLVGKTLYKKHCRSCHGNKGFGDGPKTYNLESTIREFGSEDYKNQSDGYKYYKSFVGRDEMPNFEKKITDFCINFPEEDRWFIINYMETL